jgi:hypothetical protein
MQETVLLLGIMGKIILYCDLTVIFQSLLQVNCLATKTFRAVLLLYIAHHTSIYESEGFVTKF